MNKQSRLRGFVLLLPQLIRCHMYIHARVLHVALQLISVIDTAYAAVRKYYYSHAQFRTPAILYMGTCVNFSEHVFNLQQLLSFLSFKQSQLSNEANSVKNTHQ